jgi:hypothetical protein
MNDEAYDLVVARPAALAISDVLPETLLWPFSSSLPVPFLKTRIVSAESCEENWLAFSVLDGEHFESCIESMT